MFWGAAPVNGKEEAFFSIDRGSGKACGGQGPREGKRMIILTKLNDVKFALNCDLIETIHEAPDTTIHLANGTIYIVKESMAQVISLTKAFKREIYSNQVKGEHIHGEER